MTSAPPPMNFSYVGGAMLPVSRVLADRYYGEGEIVRMAPWEDRSLASHSHFFAVLSAAWRNLPADLQDTYPSPEALRKAALIQGGYFDEEIIDVGTKAGAERVAKYVRGHDDFAHVVIHGMIVVVRHAKSQSRRSMDAKTFQRSKESVLEIVANLVGVSPQELASNKDAEA